MPKKTEKETKDSKKRKTTRKTKATQQKPCAAQPGDLRERAKREIKWFNAKARRDQSLHVGKVIRRITKQSNLDLKNVEKTFERLYARRCKFAEQYGGNIREQLRQDVARKRKQEEERLRNQEKELAPFRVKMKGNPRMILNTPVSRGCWTDIEIEDYSGCGGGPLTEDVFGDCAFDILSPGWNYLFALAHADNDGMQHLHHSATTYLRLTFEHPAPESGVFLVDRIWAPVHGEGIYTATRGKEEDWPQCMVMSTGGGLRREVASVSLTVELTQEGSHSHLRRDFPLWSYTHPEDVCEVISWDVSAASAVVDDYFLGADRGGGTITAEVTLRVFAGSYFRDETVEIDFMEPSWIILPALIMSGETVT